MSRGERSIAGWQGASLVAIAYVYFLIFAQFAFLKRLATLGVAESHLTAVMASMAIGGILISLLAPRLSLWPSPNLRLRTGLIASGAAAFLALLPLTLASSIALSFLIGAALGLLTVTLVTHLRQWTGNHNPLLLVGLGTGAGYFICNLPYFFTASAEVQSATAGVLCFSGIGITLFPVPATTEEAIIPSLSTIPFFRILACFTALVWLDSAAFFIIQNNSSLKEGAWEGSTHLWANGTLHFMAALVSVWLLRRRGLLIVLSGSFLALAIACLLLLDPHRVALASIFYPIGVSLYSVALVAYPALLSPAASTAERGRQAGWLYSIAGWSGSAMGIGMGQNLGHIPPLFVLAAGAVVLLAWPLSFIRQRERELALSLTMLSAAFVLNRMMSANDAPSQLERGRQVYISEGCINCHSQYVRPNSPDELMWGPSAPLQEIRLEHPPLIGNRRQGPDLSQVGGRRSPLWLKLHFFNPPEVSGASIMPSYAFLFRDRRGDDLVSYLVSLQGGALPQHRIEEDNWLPSSAAMTTANASDGQRLFHRYCSTCHDAGGRTRWADGFRRRPPDLTVGPYLHLSFSDGLAEQRNRLARIVKFGIHGSDMPGHEYLSDSEVASISLWLSQQIKQPSQIQ
ncbi:MAG: cbb3-type cytochrome c oxidase subunit II [Terracidiphilus sp.]|jgi:cytochrome c oxidase cbb3-type subunit 2